VLSVATAFAPHACATNETKPVPAPSSKIVNPRSEPRALAIRTNAVAAANAAGHVTEPNGSSPSSMHAAVVRSWSAVSYTTSRRVPRTTNSVRLSWSASTARESTTSQPSSTLSRRVASTASVACNKSCAIDAIHSPPLPATSPDGAPPRFATSPPAK